MAGDDKKEATIYTHYGTIPTSERRDHKAAQGRARACHHFFLRHEACVNRHLRFGKESVEANCKELLDNWRRCFAGSAAQVSAALPGSYRPGRCEPLPTASPADPLADLMRRVNQVTGHHLPPPPPLAREQQTRQARTPKFEHVFIA